MTGLKVKELMAMLVLYPQESYIGVLNYAPEGKLINSTLVVAGSKDEVITGPSCPLHVFWTLNKGENGDVASIVDLVGENVDTAFSEYQSRFEARTGRGPEEGRGTQEGTGGPEAESGILPEADSTEG